MKNYCADLQGGLWLQYNTSKNQWEAQPCCLYKERYPVQQDINKEYWLHPEIQKHRQENLDGKDLPDACFECKKTEQDGNYSRRQSWNERLGNQWKNPESVIEIDVQCDFSCNLACSICSSKFSTTWRKFDKDYKSLENRNKMTVRAKNDNVLDIISTIPTNNLKQIHFQGGEPFLSNTHVQLLEKLSETVDFSDVILWYHSNGTIKVSDKVLKLWENFKMVDIYFSIDDIGARMEYQRWPVKWKNLAENLLWYQNNIPHNAMMNIERTVGVLSAYWTDELDAWAEQHLQKTIYGDKIRINYHTCFGPYRLDAVTSEYKEDLLKKLPTNSWAYKTFKNLETDQDSHINEMLTMLNKQDQYRNLNWRTVYPEFDKWYKRYL